VSDPENPRFEASINSVTPRRMARSAGWGGLAVGDLHTCALGAHRSLWCWGSNNLGQLGIGMARPDGAAPVDPGRAFSGAPQRVPA
jgi:alpha-tubulin suppressor-like RCC1 family protein